MGDVPAETPAPGPWIGGAGEFFRARWLIERYGVDGAGRLLAIAEWDPEFVGALETFERELSRLWAAELADEAARARMEARMRR